ncbi:hypothetical protein STEG23_028205 [Scotinomys teguina]
MGKAEMKDYWDSRLDKYIQWNGYAFSQEVQVLLSLHDTNHNSFVNALPIVALLAQNMFSAEFSEFNVHILFAALSSKHGDRLKRDYGIEFHPTLNKLLL